MKRYPLFMSHRSYISGEDPVRNILRHSHTCEQRRSPGNYGADIMRGARSIWDRFMQPGTL